MAFQLLTASNLDHHTNDKDKANISSYDGSGLVCDYYFLSDTCVYIYFLIFRIITVSWVIIIILHLIEVNLLHNMDAELKTILYDSEVLLRNVTINMYALSKWTWLKQL